MESYLNEFHEKMDSINFSFFERDDIKLDKLLGSGYIGEVYEGIITLLNVDIPVVVKKLHSSSYSWGSEDEQLYEDVYSEVSMWSLTKESKNIIQFYGYSVKVEEDEVSLYIIMEKTKANGDLKSYIGDNEFWVQLTEREYDDSNSQTLLYHDEEYWDYIMSQKDKIELMVKMVNAVKDLHDSNVVHSDIKPQNMLYDGENVKLNREDCRDWIYAPDIARAVRALRDANQLRHSVYNISTGQYWSALKWGKAFAKHFTGIKCDLSVGQEKPNVETHTPKERKPLSIKRLQQDTSFAPKYDLDSSVADYYSWLTK